MKSRNNECLESKMSGQPLARARYPTKNLLYIPLWVHLGMKQHKAVNQQIRLCRKVISLPLRLAQRSTNEIGSHKLLDW